MKSTDSAAKLITFRNNLYQCFPKRGDAIMNLLDALTSHGRVCSSVVQLSTAPCFKRQYSSITDAIAQGLPEADWSAIQSLLYRAHESNAPLPVNRFIVSSLTVRVTQGHMLKN